MGQAEFCERRLLDVTDRFWNVQVNRDGATIFESHALKAASANIVRGMRAFNNENWEAANNCLDEADYQLGLYQEKGF